MKRYLIILAALLTGCASPRLTLLTTLEEMSIQDLDREVARHEVICRNTDEKIAGIEFYPVFPKMDEDQSCEAERLDRIARVLELQAEILRSEYHLKFLEQRMNEGKILPNHGLESTSAPPAAGTLETHP